VCQAPGGGEPEAARARKTGANGASYSKILGNYIGINAAETAARANGGDGIHLIAGSGNTISNGTYTPTEQGHILVSGGSVNDDIREVTSTINGQLARVSVPALLLGGSGTNTLSVAGSSVGNVLVGGSGKDVLSGGSGPDVLIGGGGSDTLNAGSGGDVLIGGITAFDANLTALEAVLAEWDSSDSYQARVRDLFGNGGVGQNGYTYLNQAAVINDVAVNQINGGGGMDWFWLEGATDKFSGDKAGEVVTVK
jgi:Ca2+-binding RTX toxin-like protein